MKWRGAGGSAASASPNNRSTSSALIVLTGLGAAAPVTRVAARGEDMSADPNSLDAFARPVFPVSGSGNSTIVVGGVGRAGGATRFEAHAAVSATAAAARSADLRIDADGNRRPSHADDRGWRFEADGVGRQLCDAARHVRRHAADEVQHHAKAAL